MAEGYHLAVVGAGPGGYVAAIKAAQEGLRVAVVEQGEAGGTCLNRGCIPTKTLLHSARLLDEFRRCGTFGIRVQDVSCDFEAMYARKDEVVAQLRGGVESLLKANRVDLIRGHAVIEGPGRLQVDGKPLECENILIACGGVPTRPPIPGLELPGVITSDELLAGGADCKRLLIIGGGVIGVEFASIFQSLGCETVLVEAMERILPIMDREISQNLTMLLKKRGVRIYTSAFVEEVTEGNEGLCCRFRVKEQIQREEADRVLVAVGRHPATSGLFAPGAAPEMDRGRLVTNERFETSIKGIYAIGDARLGSVQLAHAASAQGANAAAVLCGNKPPYDLSVIPSCVYTNPEIAAAGLDESAAKARGIPVKIGKFLMSANGKSVIEQADRGFVKLVFHAETGVLLGAQLMCQRATDLIGELCAAISNHLTAEQLGGVVRAHPTFYEAVGEAAEDAQGQAVHIAPRPKRGGK